MGNSLGNLGGSFGSSFENVPNVNQNQNGQMTGLKQMGSPQWPQTGQFGQMPQFPQHQQVPQSTNPLPGFPGGDVPAFDLPPAPQMSGYDQTVYGQYPQNAAQNHYATPHDDLLHSMYQSALAGNFDQSGTNNQQSYPGGSFQRYLDPVITDALRLANQPIPSYTGEFDGWDRMRGHHDGDSVNPNRSDPSQFDSSRRHDMDQDSPEFQEQMSLLRNTPLY